MICGFTGTQQGMSPRQNFELFRRLKAIEVTEFHHGDCIGADAEAHDIAVALGIPTVIHPPINPSKRAYKAGSQVLEEKEYLQRNRDIVSACELLFAAPAQNREQLRSGTWATIRAARRAHKLLVILQP